MNERVKVIFCPVLPEIWKNIVLFKGSQASPACPSPDGSVKTKFKILFQTPVNSDRTCSFSALPKFNYIFRYIFLNESRCVLHDCYTSSYFPIFT